MKRFELFLDKGPKTCVDDLRISTSYHCSLIGSRVNWLKWPIVSSIDEHETEEE